jgi:hypothetical protein
MGITDLLCVSLGNGKVRLHGSLGGRCACACSEASFSIQNGECAWGVYYQRTLFCCAFLVGKRTPVYSGKYLSHKAVHSWVENVLLMTKRLKRVWKWLRQQSKDFCAVGFDALVKRWDKSSVLVEDMSRNKCFFQVQISHVLRFIFICDLFTDSPL